MPPATRKTNAKSENGVALLIAIFALFLISIVALGMMVMAGTESSLNSNYKSSVQAFYDAKAGVEEARGRMWSGHPNAFGSFVVALGNTMAVGQTRYVLNPASGETVNPTDMASTNQYADRRYISEWGSNPSTSSPTTTSLSTQAGISGPLYKWVRITPRTESSAGIDVNGDSVLDNTTPLFYDGTQQFLSTQVPAGVTSYYQVFELTALSVTPSGSQRLMQYVVAPNNLGLTLPAALTFDGPTPNYNAPSSNPFAMNGSDRSGSNPMPGCTLTPQSPKPALGVVNNSDVAIAESNIPSNRLDHYLGSGATPPSISNISTSLPANEQSVSSLQSLVQSITGVASNVLTGPVTSLSSAQLGSASDPQITVVNGDLTLSGNNTGYGILVVTGTLTFSGDTGWRGIVLVIGQGNIQENGGGNNEFDGAVLVAKTLNPGGQPLTTQGVPIVNWNGGGGNGVYYDSCWINSATSGLTYKVLSFRELSQ
jgi:Tfp pilus assembly protein PilX